MKYFTLFALAFLFACSAANTNESEVLPETLDELKALQKSTKVEMKALSDKLEEIDLKIYTLAGEPYVQKRIVTTKVIEPRSFVHESTVQGAIESDELVSISSEIGGKLTAMFLKEGQSVKRGALVAKLDMETLNKQKSELNTQLNLAKDVYDRQKRLWDQKIGSEIQYLQAKNNVERLEKSIETLDFQLTKANIYAPISGVVDFVNLKSGETAGPGVPIAMILNTYNLKMVADVPENYLSNIKRGQNVKIRIPALNQEMDAKVTLIGRKIDPANRTFKVEVDLPNRKGVLKPNLLAEMTFVDFEVDDVIIIPQEKVQQEVTGKKYVLLKGEKDRNLIAEKRYVTTGDSYDGDVIIVDGLSVGDVIIDEGALSVSENDQIELAK